MAGFDPQKRSRTSKAPASVFTLANGPSFLNGMPDFSFRHTAPIQGQNSGSYWTGEEGPQYLHHDPSAHGNVQNGFIESFDSFPTAQESQTGPRNGRSSISGSSQAQWHDEITSTQIESNNMSRQDSTGAHSQRAAQSSTGNTYDESVPSRMFSNAQAPFHMSSAGMSPIRSISPQQIELQNVDYPYLGDDAAGVQHIFHSNSNAGMEPHPISVSTAGPSFAPFTTTAEEVFSFTAGSNPLGSQGPVSQESMYNPATIDSAALWDDAATNFMDSQGSSPIEPENTWTTAPFPQVLTSTTNSPMTYSPSLEGLSPRYVQDFPDLVELPPYATDDRVTRKPMGPRQSKVASDLAANSRQQRLLGSDASDDSFIRLVGRSALEIDNTARDHPLYHNVSAGPDGLYHCPWEGQSSCQHKAEKLKCNYDKFVDSHLKPYRCKVVACENLHFSSTACLLRHEREAHAMHGHGDKPFLCTYDGCERGVHGNGFPRHWNLRDHMKRVHNDPGQDKAKSPARPRSPGDSPPPPTATRGKKRKTEDKSDAQPEKAAKRVATPPVVVQEPSLDEQYARTHELATNILQQLRDPKEAARKMKQLYESMKVMAQTSQRISNVPATENFTQQTG